MKVNASGHDEKVAPKGLRWSFVGVSLVAALALSACGGDTSSDESSSAGEGSGNSEAVTVTDFAGEEVEVPADPQSIVATDNQTFRTLADWGIELSAAPIDLMPDIEELDVYTQNDDILNLGNHREPDLENLIAAEPDLIFNGYRFAGHTEDIRKDVGDDVPMVITSSDDDEEPLDEHLKQLTTLLGESLGHEDDAQKLIDDFDASIERAKEAYNSDWTVTGLITSGGDINYSAPVHGRAVGPMYPILDMTPALEDDGSTNHQGDDISIEAIAEANPDWLIVLDRDAAVEDDSSTADELIAESPALQDVTAVKEDNIYYMDPNFYTTEDIQAYTQVFNDLADIWEEAGK